jgi:hypothetical protein
VFLKTGFNPPRNVRLSLMFALHVRSNLVRLHRVTAVVARNGCDGVGMKFC